MNVKDTVESLIFESPSLFKDIDYKLSEEKVLSYLFLTLGNGFDWKDGELFCDTLVRLLCPN